MESGDKGGCSSRGARGEKNHCKTKTNICEAMAILHISQIVQHTHFQRRLHQLLTLIAQCIFIIMQVTKAVAALTGHLEKQRAAATKADLFEDGELISVSNLYCLKLYLT